LFTYDVISDLGKGSPRLGLFTRDVKGSVVGGAQRNGLLLRVRAVPRLCEFYLGICLTTEEKARKNLSQGKGNPSQVKKNLSQNTIYIYQSTHTLQNPHKYTHYKSHTHTHTHTHTHIQTHTHTRAHTHTHTLQNNMKHHSTN
jgi:hypothetical protein